MGGASVKGHLSNQTTDFLPMFRFLCRCYGYFHCYGFRRFGLWSMLRLCHLWIPAIAAIVPLLWFTTIAHGYLPLRWTFPCYGYLPSLRIFDVSTGLFVSPDYLPLLRALTAAMIVSLLRIFFRFSESSNPRCLPWLGSSAVTGLPFLRMMPLLRMFRCDRFYRLYFCGFSVSIEMQPDFESFSTLACPLMLDWAPIVKMNNNQKSEPGITCSFDCPLWNNTCIFSIKYKLRISRLPFHGTRASEKMVSGRMTD